MLSLEEFINEYKLDNSRLIQLLIAGYKYPDVPLIKQSELEEALMQHSVIFNQDSFPSCTNHCSFNALLYNINTYISLRNNRALLDYVYLSIEIFSKYQEYLNLNDPEIQLKREIEQYEINQDRLLVKRARQI